MGNKPAKEGEDTTQKTEKKEKAHKSSKKNKGKAEDIETGKSSTPSTPQKEDPQSPSKDKTAQSPPPAESKDGTGAAEEDTMHESWKDEILFSKGETKKMTPDDFELILVIGRGSFGKVFQVKKKDDGKIYAMKVLSKEAIIARKQIAHTRAEKSILQKIQHPFIVKLHYAFQTKDKLYMILDFVNGGELFFHLKKEGKFAENRVRFYGAQIACAIAHLHSLGIVYRDLKPENILLDQQGNICITDFGLSKELKEGEATTTFCGTPEYLAPEVLKGQGHGKAVDWWSLGTLIYEMLTGLPPFYSQNINIMYQKILNGELRFPSYVSPEAQSLLQGLLNRDADKRLGSTNDGWEQIKAHPFFKDIDWEKLLAKEVPPPFDPKVKDGLSTTNFDTAFTDETPKDSLPKNTNIDYHFPEFTLNNDSNMEAKPN